ncbi:MAG: single-stranded DNA-binding protein [Bacilli bacterium]|nr:single-stranded DNA-binding protein [Bacilli bacterium]
MKEKMFVASSLQEVEELAVKELAVAKDDMYFDVISETETEVQVNVIVDANPVKKGKDFLEKFLENANILGFVERKMRDNVVEYCITTENANGLLIGKNSKTLSALQHVTSLIVNQYFDPETESGLIVKVDIGDYRRRRDENLEKMATRIAKEVAKTKVPVKLNYMNAYERKVIHNKLSTWRDVTTHSEGVEPQRYLIIEPKHKK